MIPVGGKDQDVRRPDGVDDSSGTARVLRAGLERGGKRTKEPPFLGFRLVPARLDPGDRVQETFVAGREPMDYFRDVGTDNVLVEIKSEADSRCIHRVTPARIAAISSRTDFRLVVR